MCYSHQLPTFAPGGDVFLAGLGSDGEGGGGLEEGLGIELGREVGPELLLAEDEGLFKDTVFHDAEGGEDHGDAEGDKAQAADGGRSGGHGVRGGHPRRLTF